MKLPTDPVKRILLAACALILLFSILRWSFPLLKILITLAVIFIAWHYTGEDEEKKPVSFSGIVNETREENGVHIRRNVFSRSVLDLTDSSTLPEKIELQSAFSILTVRLPVDAKITLHASGAFCSISLPDRQSILFGENTVHCGSKDSNAPRIHIDLNCAFSSVSFRMG